jgi:two-component system, cell cycle sensor histidine kinase and response regulator CckA
MELSRAHASPIDLLLTDVVMPGMSGPRLAEVLIPERAGMRCIFMSGYAATTLEQKILLRSDAAFLQKPFTATELMGRVRDVLDGRASPAVE